MVVLLLFAISIPLTAFTALVFSLLTILLGKVWQTFEISGSDEWSFWSLYLRYLIVGVLAQATASLPQPSPRSSCFRVLVFSCSRVLVIT